MKRTKVLVSLISSIALGSIVSGCGSSSTNAATTSSTSPTKGGTIVFAQVPQTTYTWYIPIVDAAYDYNAGLYDEIYKPLLWINNNYTINWKSSIADKITYNKTGTIYHIYLNPKWHWSNGSPVTSKDFMFTWDIIKAASANNAPTPWPYVGAGTGDIPTGVKSVVPNGPYEVTMTLKQPTNQDWFIYNGIIQIVPMPHIWDVKPNITAELKYLGSEAINPHFVSVVDGPFKLGKVVPEQSWTLIPNQAYSGHKSLVKKIVLLYEGSNSAEFAAMKTGVANMGYLDVSQWGARSELTQSGDVITPEYTFSFFDTALNLFPGSPVRSIFKHLYVRQAMQMGLDNAAINQSIYHGFAPSIDGPLPKNPLTTFYDSALNRNPYPFNIKAGKTLLESHGWRDVKGVMTKGSQKMSFQMLYAAGSTSSTEAAELMQQDWQEEGIDVSLKPVPFSTLIGEASQSYAKHWEMATGTGWYYDGPGFYPSGDGLFNTGAASGFGYSSQEENALIDATHLPYATSKENTAAFFRYEVYTAKALPVLWQNNAGTLVVHAPDVHNSVKYDDASPGIPQMQYWWVSGEK